MSDAKPGTGSAYAAAFRDETGAFLDGGSTCSVTLPGPIPARDLWSFTVYDNQTRSLLPTDQNLAGLGSDVPGIHPNKDGGVTIWFGPRPPAGREKNWVQTIPARRVARKPRRTSERFFSSRALPRAASSSDATVRQAPCSPRQV